MDDFVESRGREVRGSDDKLLGDPEFPCVRARQFTPGICLTSQDIQCPDQITCSSWKHVVQDM